MKTQHYIICFLITICFIKKVESQSYQEHLIGKWTLNYEVSKSKMTTDAKTRYEKKKPERKERFRQAYENRKLIFNNDGIFSIKFKNGNTVSGTWLLDNNDIVLTSTKGDSQKLKIKTLSNILLVVKLENKGSAKPTLAELYYNKNR